MRRVALLLVFAAFACQGCRTASRERERLTDARDRENDGLDEKRKDAIFDLSRDSRLNPSGAYLDRQVPPRR